MSTAAQTIGWLETKFREATLNKYRFVHNKRQGIFYSQFADELAALIVMIQDEDIDEYGLSFKQTEL